MPDWARTIARHVLYEAADAVRIEALVAGDDVELAGLAGKIDREEIYHRMHAQMWADRLRDEPRFQEALEELWPYAAGLLPASQRPLLAQRLERPITWAVARGSHTPEFEPLWEEMTEVRRSIPGATW